MIRKYQFLNVKRFCLDHYKWIKFQWFTVTGNQYRRGNFFFFWLPIPSSITEYFSVTDNHYRWWNFFFVTDNHYQWWNYFLLLSTIANFCKQYLDIIKRKLGISSGKSKVKIREYRTWSSQRIQHDASKQNLALNFQDALLFTNAAYQSNDVEPRCGGLCTYFVYTLYIYNGKWLPHLTLLPLTTLLFVTIRKNV